MMMIWGSWNLVYPSERTVSTCLRCTGSWTDFFCYILKTNLAWFIQAQFDCIKLSSLNINIEVSIANAHPMVELFTLHPNSVISICAVEFMRLTHSLHSAARKIIIQSWRLLFGDHTIISGAKMSP